MPSKIILVALGILAAAAVALAAFPWSVARVPLSRALSAQLGRTVTIAGIARLDHFSFEPVIRLTGVSVAQPAWVGPGEMMNIASLTLRLPLLKLVGGRFAPSEITITGLQLNLVRQSSGRSNWAGRDKAPGSSSSSSFPLRQLRITDSVVRLSDDKRHIRLTASLAADQAHGLTIDGDGVLRDQPLHLRAVGGSLEAIDPGTPYQFDVWLTSPLVRVIAAGRMDHALDTGHFTAHVRSGGDDLAYLDDIIQAGVPATQKFTLDATVRNDGSDWIITALTGTIGRSDLAGALTVRKRQGRSILDGNITANAFDFDDLSSDAQKARAAAKQRLTGKRILPDTAIHFEKLSHTDGIIRFDAKRLLMSGKSPFVGLRATLTMDHRLLTVSPVEASLVHGTLGGTIVVDHRQGDPKLDVRLNLNGGRIEDVLTDAKYASAPLDGRIRLHGTGRSVREALGQSDGTIDLIARGGTIKRSVATLAAGDILRGAGLLLSRDGDETVPIRCIVGRFVARRGQVTAADLILDTTVMRAGGGGRVDLGSEAIDITLAGRSKHPDLIQTTVPVHVGGTLAAPTFDVAPVDAAEKKLGLFGRIGAIVKSLRTRNDDGRDTRAADAPCNALAMNILR